MTSPPALLELAPAGSQAKMSRCSRDLAVPRQIRSNAQLRNKSALRRRNVTSGRPA